MRILHTSDWHLGRTFHGESMLPAQRAFIDHLVSVVVTREVDAVVVAGDIYDRALPSVEVVNLLDDALARLAETGVHVILTSGNHDSAIRLGFGSRLLSAANIHIRTDPAQVADPVILSDPRGAEYGHQLACYPLPFLEPAAVAETLHCKPTHEAVLGTAMAAVRADLAVRRSASDVPIRSIVAAHTFVVGGQGSDSERDLSVGGVATVPAALFTGVDYVALGHLHRPQEVRDAALSGPAYYSGSPLAYSFGEHGYTKGMVLVTMTSTGVSDIETIPVPTYRPLALLRGELQTLLADPTLHTHEQSWCQVTLTDAERPAQPLERLRARFPGVLELRFAPPVSASAVPAQYTQRVHGRDDLAVCQEFVAHVRHRAATSAETQVFSEALTHIRMTDTESHGAVALRARTAATADTVVVHNGGATDASGLLDLEPAALPLDVPAVAATPTAWRSPSEPSRAARTPRPAAVPEATSIQGSLFELPAVQSLREAG